MVKVFRNICISLMMLTVPLCLAGQEKGMEYHTLFVANPGVAGCEGNGTLRLSYMNYYPGYNYNLHSVTISYDGYFSEVHGGAGFYLSNDYLGGIVNDLKGGFSYSYYFKAGSDLYFSPGLSASFTRRAFSFSGIVFPDQIDPLLGAVLTSSQVPADMSHTVFDLTAGTGIFYKGLFGGISVSHLTQPDLSAGLSTESRIPRTLLLHLTGETDISSAGNLRLRPAGKLEYHRGFVSGGGGAVIETNYFSASTMLFYNNLKHTDIQTGIQVKVKDMKLFYAYRFNLAGGENLLPVSVLHSTGIALSLKNVDKRKTVKTINFPEL